MPHLVIGSIQKISSTYCLLTSTSTGPRTVDGKARVAANANKGGVRPMLRDLARASRAQKKAADEMFAAGEDKHIRGVRKK